MIRRKFRKWKQPWYPETDERMDPGSITHSVIEEYQAGGIGAKESTKAQKTAFAKQMLEPDGEKVVKVSGMFGSGEGKLCIPFVHVLELYPKAWPGPGQQRGDCVSWGTRNAALTTMCGDIKGGKKDEKSGKPEKAPKVSAAGESNGVLSTETFYWWRGYDGDGWMCYAAAKVATGKSGLMLRQNYGDLGVDLTRYSGRAAGKYGRRPPPSEWREVMDDRLVHEGTNAQAYEAMRDLCYNNYGILDCGGEGWRSSRDEWGVSRRSGSWSHSMSVIGVDDREIIKSKYGGPLVLILNSWGKWNSGGRDIYKSANLVPADKKDLWVQKGIVNPETGNFMIPHGSFWAKWSDCRRRERIAFSGVHGWPTNIVPVTTIDFNLYV